ncbi:UDP-N-acetylmuramoyl-tripeptide--D-alanyl-D-alanine ligase [Chryseobacterium sp. SNU WT5]|uniref:UDP-N-acetylmuramoyl-tripeptide--D-alanyl-D- alanine ligase n=1 Tax=Chryseobacterium sp. SNU WT5 TaxID=2594269 RepID=UPI00118057EE|nr:UDP-N-acetylmuramoyl-tripeptide--D-alanyl-D-alanine ligase [Chryseobacterium sp. SNU WT5]QDP86178.1 UDP-N-acetylmuramoyl-tripeptide--D-alanyl-D-alanine ligase [Chryseobacterium sp. SNU WT5]
MNAASFYPLFLKCGKVTIDSRKIEENDLFFAFSGETFNAATQAEDAVNNGALAAIVEHKEYENTAKNIFYVPSTLIFLQELAMHHRDQLSIPIIALTGSNGKTTTKEIIHAVLSQKYNVQYTYGNLNNHIGVPLTLLSIKTEHEIAVVEMGANHQHEIEALCNIAKPTIGYITNFGKAHLEGFGGFQGVIKGKSELYNYLIKNSQTILINENDPIQLEKTEGYQLKITFGSNTSDYNFQHFSEDNLVGLSFENENVLSKLTGNYNYTNLCAAATLGFHFDVNFDQVKTAIEHYIPTNMRSQLLERNGKVFVLDTYNANPSSMKESLKNFSGFVGSKTIIIGDMLELGDESEREHQGILDLAHSLCFDEIVTVGNHFSKVNSDSKAFKSSAELSTYLNENRICSKNILLKASRGIALENILEHII